MKAEDEKEEEVAEILESIKPVLTAQVAAARQVTIEGAERVRKQKRIIEFKLDPTQDEKGQKSNRSCSDGSFCFCLSFII